MTHTLTDPDCPQSVRDQINGGVTQEAREIAAEVLRSEGVNPDWQARAYTDLLARVAQRALTTNQAKCEQLEAALRRLEAANNEVCRLRTPDMYLAMIHAGQEEALEELDAARREARAALPSTGASRG